MRVSPERRSTSRSYLYVPADREDMLDGALLRGADAVILDLEDSVAAARKQVARDAAIAWLGRTQSVSTSVWVRVNADSVEADVQAVGSQPIAGIMLPAATPRSLEGAEKALAECEREHLRDEKLAVIALVETAEGLLHLPEIARHPLVTRMAIGAVDLTAELRWSVDPESPELLGIYAQVVIASAAAGIAAPIAPTSLGFGDTDAIAASTARFAARGFRGRTAIHPAQLAAIHDGFAPSEHEIAVAQDVLERYRKGVAMGSGVAIDMHGSMIDLAVVRSAMDVLSRVVSPDHL